MTGAPDARPLRYWRAAALLTLTADIGFGVVLGLRGHVAAVIVAVLMAALLVPLAWVLTYAIRAQEGRLRGCQMRPVVALDSHGRSPDDRHQDG